MRILVVSDIHANWAALEAITHPFDVCLCLGDLVDYGPDPAPCVRWAMAHATYAIRGNHDHGVAQGISVSGESGFKYLTGATRPSMWGSLGPQERRYLLQLPVTVRCTLAGKRFLLVHATPRDPLDEILPPDPDAWAKRLEGVEADIVCVGHTHQQFAFEVGGTLVVNPGSVGLPRDGDPRAAYAVLHDDLIEFRRVEYPIEESVRAVQASPLPDRAKEMLTGVYRTGALQLPPKPVNGEASGIGYRVPGSGENSSSDTRYPVPETH
jgi:putative phosphoesterase